jgi:glutamate carboxypeptidase
MAVADREALKNWLAGHHDEMLELLEAAVNIDSGSHDKEGVDRVGELFRSWLAGAGITVNTHPMPANGNCLSAEIPSGASAAAASILLLGHMDTVFPKGTVARRPFRMEGNTAWGPGVADMKAGLVMNAFVARAFAELGGSSNPIRLLFTGDEEIASPASRELTQAMARGAHAVFNAEPGRPSGNVVTGRKGALFVDFEVKGVAAHAGVAPEKGASAIEALARKVVELHQLADPSSGVSANVGTVRGGMSVNAVADFAAGQLDVRFPASVDQEVLRARILEIIERQSPPRTCGCVTHIGSFLPLAPSPKNERLLVAYQTSAASLGLSVHGEFTGGSADSGLTSAVGAPTLCATGPLGGDVHTDREYCRVDSLVPRAQALALTILQVGVG